MREPTTAEADGRIIPDNIPGLEIKPDNIDAAASTLESASTGMNTHAESIRTSWSRLPSVYQAPTGPTVHHAMAPAITSTTTFTWKLQRVAIALREFANQLRPLLAESKNIQTDAQAFRDEIDGGVWVSLSETKKYEGWYVSDSAAASTPGGPGGVTGPAASGAMTVKDALAKLRNAGEDVRRSGGGIEILASWKESSEHVDRNNRLLDRAADQYAKFSSVEADCANTINAERDSCVAPIVPVEAWQLKQDGDNTADLPWGHRSEEDRNCGEGVWNGVGTGVKGIFEGLGTLVGGFNPQRGGFFDGSAWLDGDVWGSAWVGLGTSLGSVILATSPAAQIAGAFPGPFHDFMTDANKNAGEFFKGFVAWDKWAENPAEAFGETLFNVATIVIPGPKGLGAALKGTSLGGKAAEAVNVGLKGAGDVIRRVPEFFKKTEFDKSFDGKPHAGVPENSKVPEVGKPSGTPNGHVPDGPGHTPEGPSHTSDNSPAHNNGNNSGSNTGHGGDTPATKPSEGGNSSGHSNGDSNKGHDSNSSGHDNGGKSPDTSHDGKPDSGKPDSGSDKPGDNHNGKADENGNGHSDSDKPSDKPDNDKPDGDKPADKPGPDADNGAGDPRTPKEATPSNPTGEKADPDWSSSEKGRFGEAQTHAYMTERGYERVDIPAKSVNANGIDAIYRSPDGDIVIVESKYGSSTLGKTEDGRQMSDDWLEGTFTEQSRILKAVGDVNLAKEISDALGRGDVQRILSKIDESGVVTLKQLDANGYVIRGVTPSL